MGPFNRNIITDADIRNLLSPDKGTPKTLGSAPPAGEIPGPSPVPATPAGTLPDEAHTRGGIPPADGAPATGATIPRTPDTNAPGATTEVKVPSADDYLTKLLKYVPIEVLGAYLFVEGLVKTNVSQGSDERQSWLFWTLVAAIALTVVYARAVLGVVRVSQVAMAAVGISVYVFATGGWFATTNWYEDWFSGIALVLFAFLVAIIKLPALPTEKT